MDEPNKQTITIKIYWNVLAREIDSILIEQII